MCVCVRVGLLVLRRRRHDAGRLVCREKFRANKRPNKSSLARTGPPSDFSTPRCNAASTAKQLTVFIFLRILILDSFPPLLSKNSKLISIYYGNYGEDSSTTINTVIQNGLNSPIRVRKDESFAVSSKYELRGIMWAARLCKSKNLRCEIVFYEPLRLLGGSPFLLRRWLHRSRGHLPSFD